MSRSGYVDDDIEDYWAHIRWRGQVTSAIRGKRGQALLRDLLQSLDAMPQKQLISEDLELDGQVCALGALGRARGMNMSEIDPEDYGQVADAFGVAGPLVREIMYVNDEWKSYTPEERFAAVRQWVQSQIKQDQANAL